MKKIALSVCLAAGFAGSAFAGPDNYYGKEMKQVEQVAPCPSWYADNEWNVTLSGIYAPTTNPYREDTYLGVDHAYGGAIDVKYFFRRYFGLGVQGFGLAINTDDHLFRNVGDDDSRNDFAGGVLGTFTLRYPIPCTRFAPYGWVGAGGIFGGGGGRFVRNNNFVVDRRGEEDGRFMGQYGAGFEVRFTPHVGWTNDVSFNHLEGSHNDFVQVRTGVSFAF